MRWSPPKDAEYRSHLPPTIDDTEEDLAEREIQYDDTPSDCYVISGPLPGGTGPGRRYDSAREAYRDVAERFGRRYMGPIREAHPGGRWAARIRRPSNG